MSGCKMAGHWEHQVLAFLCCSKQCSCCNAYRQLRCVPGRNTWNRAGTFGNHSKIILCLFFSLFLLSVRPSHWGCVNELWEKESSGEGRCFSVTISWATHSGVSPRLLQMCTPVKSTRTQGFAYGVWGECPCCGKWGLTAHCWSIGFVGIRVYTAQYRQLKKLYTVITHRLHPFLQ